VPAGEQAIDPGEGVTGRRPRDRRPTSPRRGPSPLACGSSGTAAGPVA
jgi:hypothetical protein